jgi:hypothetical protein
MVNTGKNYKYQGAVLSVLSVSAKLTATPKKNSHE